MSLIISSPVPGFPRITFEAVPKVGKLDVIETTRHGNHHYFRCANNRLYSTAAPNNRLRIDYAGDYLTPLLSLKLITRKQVEEHRKYVRMARLDNKRRSDWRQFKQLATKYSLPLPQRYKKVILGKLSEQETPLY